MPELPEVEVVKKSLEKSIINLTIKNVKIYDRNLRYKVKNSETNKLIGLKFKKILRRSKYLLFYFDNNIVMIIHLGMTGKFFIMNKRKKKRDTGFHHNSCDKLDDKHDHIVFTLTNELRLIYNDVRKFGFVKLTDKNNLQKNLHLKYLGPEPLEKSFNFQYFKKYLKGKKRTIKNLLMDQKFVAGLGNIYVNEVLFFSEIKPKRKINTLQDIELKKIIANVKTILKKAIEFGGSSIKNFSGTTGKNGSFQQFFGVYGKEGKNCSNTDCKKIIKRIVLSNRSSFYCPKCQK